MASGDGRWSCDHNKIDPNSRLMTWEKWVKIRQNQTNILAKNTDRQPADLVMNLSENVRQKKEQKTVLENAKLQTKVKTFRGTVWEQPERLKQCCNCQPVYEVHRTSTDVGSPPIIEHIGVPKCIQETEKGLTGAPQRKLCEKLDSEYVKYKNAYETKFKNKIKKIDPYRAEIDELVIMGSKVKYPKRKQIVFTPSIVISKEDNQQDSSCAIYALQINKTILFKEEPGQTLTHLRQIQKEEGNEFCKSWSYYFNVGKKKASRAKLYLKNLGTVAIHYCWKKIRRSVPFIPEDNQGQVFFFNKNEDVLSPGQSKSIFFTFVSNNPGIFSEFWELSTTNVCFLDDTSDKITINLYADAVDNIPNQTRKIEKLKLKIEEEAVHFNILNIVIDIVNKATTIMLPSYPYDEMLTEKEMFELKNPVCFYHQTEVAKLKAYYAEMQLDEQLWDMSIASWRVAMIKKDFDDRMYYYDILKSSYRKLLKPWYEGTGIFEQKIYAVKILLAKLADTFDVEKKRQLQLYGKEPRDSVTSNSNTEQLACPIFYIRMRKHIGDTVEQCAGIISSIDLNRWIDFDFCHLSDF